MLKQKGNVLIIILVIILISVIGLGGYYLGKNNSTVSNNSQVTISQTSSSTPTLTSTSSSSVTATPDPTANWKTYTNQKYSYTVKYPADLTLLEDNTYYHYVSFNLPKNSSDTSLLPPFYISAIPDKFIAKDIASVNFMSSDLINSLYNLKTDETKQVTGTTFKKLSDIKIAGEPAIMVGVTATGFNQQRVFIKRNGYIYMLGNYNPSDDFPNFLSSFKFTN